MLKRISNSRAFQMRLYRIRRRDYLATHPWCEAHEKVMPGKRVPPATEIHHTAGRNGRLLCDSAKFLGVCVACHFWITNAPAEARKLGLIAPLGQWNTTDRTKWNG